MMGSQRVWYIAAQRRDVLGSQGVLPMKVREKLRRGRMKEGPGSYALVSLAAVGVPS